jgi:hypothetical protein
MAESPRRRLAIRQCAPCGESVSDASWPTAAGDRPIWRTRRDDPGRSETHAASVATFGTAAEQSFIATDRTRAKAAITRNCRFQMLPL